MKPPPNACSRDSRNLVLFALYDGKNGQSRIVKHLWSQCVTASAPDYDALIAMARTARERAYCPYSGFAVGAAALTASGKVFLGCNVENAAYPAAICAERSALVGAYAAGEREIVAIAVVADTPEPVSPCGTCRQVIHELARGAKVVLANMRGDVALITPQDLLPGGFTSASLPLKGRIEG
jgi:cytidine deaminase